MSTCDHICRECGGGMNCQHCKPYQLPIDRHRIAELEASLAKSDRQVQAMAGVIREAMVYVTVPPTLEKMKTVTDGI